MNRNAWMQGFIEMLLEQADRCDKACSRVVKPGVEGSSEVAAALIRSSAAAKTIAAHLKKMLSDRKDLTYELGGMMFWIRNSSFRVNLSPYDLKGNWEALVSATGIDLEGMKAGFADEAQRLGYTQESAEELFSIELAEVLKGTADENCD